MLKNLYRKTEKTRSKSLLILSAVQDTVNRTLNKQHTLPSFFLMLSCGHATARKIGEQAGAKIIIGRRGLYSVEKVKNYLSYLEE